MTKTIHNGSKERNDLEKGLAKGDDIVARLIGGATLGAFVGGAVSAGSGIMPGAVVGAIVGVATPKAVSGFGRLHTGHKS